VEPAPVPVPNRVARRGWRWRQIATLVALVVLALGAVYETAQALGWISIGDQPGEGAPGSSAVDLAAFLALLVGLVVAFASVRSAAEIPLALRVLLPLVAVGWAAIGYYTFDPYYAPTQRRFSDYNGSGPTIWIVGLTCAAVAVGLASKWWPKPAMIATTLVLLLCIPTLFLGFGH
jgi:hypothetical protein